MTMKNAVLAVIVIALVALGIYAFSMNRAAAPTGGVPAESALQGATTTPEASAGEDGGPAFATVTLTENGFSPSTVTVARGETVRFINDSARGMWVASDEHPTHTDYDGTSTREHCADGAPSGSTFDQCAAVEKGEFWDYTFEKSGTFSFHNHVGATNTGTVVVR